MILELSHDVAHGYYVNEMKSLLLYIPFGLLMVVFGLLVLYEPYIVGRAGYQFDVPRWAGAFLVFVGVYAIVDAIHEVRRKK